MLRTKSVWSPIQREDGLRILATRFRGRGMPKDRYNVWMANLGPSEALLEGIPQWMRHLGRVQPSISHRAIRRWRCG